MPVQIFVGDCIWNRSTHRCPDEVGDNRRQRRFGLSHCRRRCRVVETKAVAVKLNARYHFLTRCSRGEIAEPTFSQKRLVILAFGPGHALETNLDDDQVPAYNGSTPAFTVSRGGVLHIPIVEEAQVGPPTSLTR